MAGKLKDLIDTRGRRTLSLTEMAHERRDSVQNVSRERARSRTPEPPSKSRRPNVDLGALLQPVSLPHNKYKAIQSVLFEQDKLITAREEEVKDRCTQISRLHKDLDEARERTDRDKERIFKNTNEIMSLNQQLARAKKENETMSLDLRKRKRHFTEVNEDHEDLLTIGRKVLAEKNQAVERLTAENEQLRATISDRDASISSLNNQILRISMASSDEKAAIAIEASAQRTLNMVKGLQRDVKERDQLIKLHKINAEVLADGNKELSKEKADLEAKNAELEKALKIVQKKAAESREILEEQNTLIDRIMADNARFVEAN